MNSKRSKRNDNQPLFLTKLEKFLMRSTRHAKKESELKTVKIYLNSPLQPAPLNTLSKQIHKEVSKKSSAVPGKKAVAKHKQVEEIRTERRLEDNKLKKLISPINFINREETPTLQFLSNQKSPLFIEVTDDEEHPQEVRANEIERLSANDTPINKYFTQAVQTYQPEELEVKQIISNMGNVGETKEAVVSKIQTREFTCGVFMLTINPPIRTNIIKSCADITCTDTENKPVIHLVATRNEHQTNQAEVEELKDNALSVYKSNKELDESQMNNKETKGNSEVVSKVVDLNIELPINTHNEPKITIEANLNKVEDIKPIEIIYNEQDEDFVVNEEEINIKEECSIESDASIEYKDRKQITSILSMSEEDVIDEDNSIKENTNNVLNAQINEVQENLNNNEEIVNKYELRDNEEIVNKYELRDNEKQEEVQSNVLGDLIRDDKEALLDNNVKSQCESEEQVIYNKNALIDIEQDNNTKVEHIAYNDTNANYDNIIEVNEVEQEKCISQINEEQCSDKINIECENKLNTNREEKDELDISIFNLEILKKNIANSVLKIQNAYRRYQLRKTIHKMHETKIIAAKKIANEIMHWYRKEKDAKLFRRYINHCVTIIQRNYRIYHLKKLKNVKKRNIKTTIKNIYNELDINHILSEETPITSSNKSSLPTNVEVEPMQKRQFLKRRQVYDPKKSIESAKKANAKSKEGVIEAWDIEGKTVMTQSSEGNKPKDSFKDVDFQSEIINLVPKKPFLKRKSKRVGSKRLNWEQVSRKIDCWNVRSKSSEKKVIHKPTLPHKRNQTSVQRSAIITKSTERKGKSRSNHKVLSLTQKMHKEELKPQLSTQELSNTYFRYHGDNQSKFIYNNRY